MSVRYTPRQSRAVCPNVSPIYALRCIRIWKHWTSATPDLRDWHSAVCENGTRHYWPTGVKVEGDE